MGTKDRECSLLLIPIFQIFYVFPSLYCHEIYNITSSQALSQGQSLVSSSQNFELGFFSPNNSANQYVGMWYKGIPPRTVVWVANRENPITIADSAAATLMIGSNGNLELVNGNDKSVMWSTNIRVRSNSSIAVLSDNGNLVLNDGISGETLWQSFYHSGDTFMPGATLGYNLKTGDNYVLTSWKSDSDPSPGNFTVGISKQSPPEAFVWINGLTPYWRSGPWDKSKFIGIPEMDTSYQSSLSLQQDLDKGTTILYFNMYNNSVVPRLFVSSQGVLAILLGDKTRSNWENNWEAPRSRCDFYGVCGPFGVCKASDSPICKCLKGFVPKSYQEWRNGHWTGGCERRTELLCEKSNNSEASQGGKQDGFYKMSTLKLPDFYEFVPVDDANGCYTWCLNNCSCAAYAYVNGIGCLVWSESLIDILEFPSGGEDLFLRLAQTELVKGQKITKTVISLAVISCSVIFIGLVFSLKRRRANQKRQVKETTEQFGSNETGDLPIQTLQSAKHNPSELCIFDLDSILVATNHFNIKNKLGQGGFGSVYKGKLQDGREIAVKRLSSSSGQGIEELKNETILISKLQHRNLVKLLGFCIEEEEKILVLELMPNRSLDTFIFDPMRSAELNWATRFNIIHGVARGLVYLHRDSCLRVIHRDLKVSNILLDEKMNPKISDFGLARIFHGTMDLVNTHRVVGTFGYMSPEYAMGGIFSEKSDVFSFGVMLLEIVSGKKNSSFHYYEQELSLIAHAWKLWNESRGLDLVDDALSKSYSASEALRCIHIGLLCVQDHAADRPTMPDVVSMLISDTDCPLPKQPFFTFQSSPWSQFQAQNGTKCSVNEATITSLEGR